MQTPETKSLLPSLYKREEFPSLEKRGEGRFGKNLSAPMMDSAAKKRELSPLHGSRAGNILYHFVPCLAIVLQKRKGQGEKSLAPFLKGLFLLPRLHDG